MANTASKQEIENKQENTPIAGVEKGSTLQIVDFPSDLHKAIRRVAVDDEIPMRLVVIKLLTSALEARS